LKNFLSRLFPKKVDAPTMSQADADVMTRYAGGDDTAKHEAIAAYRRNLLVPGARSTLLMRYMAEVDTPSPDLMLRSDLRAKLQQKIAA
jgi:hypothetical protein